LEGLGKEVKKSRAERRRAMPCVSSIRADYLIELTDLLQGLPTSLRAWGDLSKFSNAGHSMEEERNRPTCPGRKKILCILEMRIWEDASGSSMRSSVLKTEPRVRAFWSNSTCCLMREVWELYLNALPGARIARRGLATKIPRVGDWRRLSRAGS